MNRINKTVSMYNITHSYKVRKNNDLSQGKCLYGVERIDE